MIVNLDRLFGSFNLSDIITKSDLAGFELITYTDTPSKGFTDMLNESYFCDQSKEMRFLIQEWPEKTKVGLYDFHNSTPLVEVEYNTDNPMLEMLLRKLCNPSKKAPPLDDKALKSQVLREILGDFYCLDHKS